MTPTCDAAPAPTGVETALLDAVRTVAAREIMPRFGRLASSDVSLKSGPDDPVTVADKAAEAALQSAFAHILPDAAFVGEEGVAENPTLLDAISTAERAVIVDPIDGTANYATGLPLFGVIIAVVERGETVFGLLYDPVTDDCVAARRGAGAWRERADGQREPLQTRSAPFGEASGLVPINMYDKADRPGIMAAYAGVGKIRSLRCSCHEYRSLAAGHVDFIVSPRPAPWDHAAGVLVATEAGGAAQMAGAPYRPGGDKGPLTVAARPHLLEPLVSLQATI
ncbi:MAG: inositol monophosphatase [Pseudomonadota bacterium]